MGMSASQARFLGLTARKSNVEFEGQQINQQRTTLSNESANYYNDLLGMTVPVPPSVDNYTKTVYTFEDGALSNSITALIPSSKGDGTYSVSYLREYTDDFAVVSSSSSIVTRVDEGNGVEYNIGATTLRSLGDLDATEKVGSKITLNGQSYAVQEDAQGYYIETTSQVAQLQDCTQDEINNIEYYDYDTSADEIVRYYKDSSNNFYSLDEEGNQVNSNLTENDLIMILFDENETDVSNATTFVYNNGGQYQKEVYVDEISKQYLTDSQVSSITALSLNTDDEYLNSLSSDQLSALKIEEQEYLKLLKNEYGQDTDWMVRYVQNTSTGEYQPYFYNTAKLSGANYDDKTGNSLSSISCYTIGSKNVTEEVKNLAGVKIEQDSTGRYINISFPQYDDEGNVIEGSQMTTYALTTNTSTDQDAYDDAMNQYEYEKYQYDQSINDINSKIEVIQAEDKNLELRLKQLDTEQEAITQEIESVSNVIKKNIESSFKTFG